VRKQAIWIVRHGHREDTDNPDWDATARWPHDPGLSPTGIAQIKAVAERVRGEPVGHIISSPFLRAVETASIVAEALGLPVKAEAGMSEWLRDIWFAPRPTLIPLEDKAARFPALDLSYRSCVTPTYPETPEVCRARVAKTVELLLERFSGNLLLVGHGASVSFAAEALVGPEAGVRTPIACLIRIVRGSDGWDVATAAAADH